MSLLLLLSLIFLGGCSHSNSPAALDELQEADRQYDLGQIVQAQNWTRKAIALSDEDEVLQGDEGAGNGVIGILMAHGDYALLCQILSTEIKKPEKASNPAYYEAYGEALKHMGQSDQARAIYGQGVEVLRKKDSNTTGFFNNSDSNLVSLADFEWNAGNIDQSVLDFETARKKLPDSAATLYNNQAYLEAEGSVRLPEALSFAQKAVSSATNANDPTTLAMYLDTRGWVFYKMFLASGDKSQISASVSDFESAVSNYPADPDVCYHLAKAYEAAGRIDDAVIAYSRLVNLVIADPLAKKDLDRVAALSARLNTGANKTSVPIGNLTASKKQ